MGFTFDETEFDDTPDRPHRPGEGVGKIIEELYEDPPESNTSTLSEAERRLEIATYYKAAMKGGFFENKTAISNIVEKEIYDFCCSRLEQLLGITQADSAINQAEFKLPFDKDQITALEMLANKVLNRNPNVPVTKPKNLPPTVKKAIVQEQKIRQVTPSNTLPVGTSPAPLGTPTPKPKRQQRQSQIPGAKRMPTAREMEQISQQQAQEHANNALQGNNMLSLALGEVLKPK